MNVFKVALPNQDVKHARVQDLALDSLHPNPKISTVVSPLHTGIIFLNWVDTSARAYGSTLNIYYFSHGYDYVPTVFASYKFDNGSTIRKGMLPFSYGALGMIIIDADIKNINLKYYSLDLSGASAIPAFVMQIRFYVMSERGVDH